MVWVMERFPSVPVDLVVVPWKCVVLSPLGLLSLISIMCWVVTFGMLKSWAAVLGPFDVLFDLIRCWTVLFVVILSVVVVGVRDPLLKTLVTMVLVLVVGVVVLRARNVRATGRSWRR